MDTSLVPGDRAPGPINALLLDDSAFDRQQIRRLSQQIGLDIAFQEAPTLTAMSDLMQEREFDLVMIDYHLADGDGLRALELVRADDRNRNAASIMITGSENIDVAVLALKKGCHDYLRKQDISAQSLRAAITDALTACTRYPARATAPLQEEVVQSLVLALNDDRVRQSLRPALVAGLRDAADIIGLEQRFAATVELQTFLRSFDTADSFEFAPGILRSRGNA